MFSTVKASDWNSTLPGSCNRSLKPDLALLETTRETKNATLSLRVQAESFAMPGAESRSASSAPALQGRRLVMRDNIHLFDPGAEHHEVLATEGTGATSPGPPLLASSCSHVGVISLSAQSKHAALVPCIQDWHIPLR